MDVGATLRGTAPVIALAGGAAVIGAASSYAATRYAGESEGGDAAKLVGTVASKSLFTGGLAGVLTGFTLGRIGGGAHTRGLRGVLLIPAGISGSAGCSRVTASNGVTQTNIASRTP